MKKNNYLIYLSSFISLAIIPTIIGLYFAINKTISLLSNSTDPDAMEAALGYTIHHTLFMASSISFAILIAIQMIISAYLINGAETKAAKIIGKINLLLGGLGLSLVYVIFIKFKKNESPKIKYRKNSKIKIISSSLVALTAVSIPTIGLYTYMGVDKPTTSKPVYFSLNKNTPNIIEIFTDGFDPDFGKKAIDESPEAFKDFTMLTKYVVTGPETSYSFPTIMAGLKQNNFAKKDGGKSGSSMSERNAATFPSVVDEHLTGHKENEKVVEPKRNPYLIDTNSMVKEGNYMQNHSGDPSVLKKRNHFISQVNYAQAKHDTLGKFGIGNYSDQQMFYEWFHRNSYKGDGQKGARVLLQEFMTHAPRTTAPDGSLSFKTGETKDGKDITTVRANKSLVRNWKRMFNDLKNIKSDDGKTNAYDNSLILIFGDHANHFKALPHHNNDKTNAEKYHSLAMVKYPYSIETTRSSYKVFDKPFYAPFLQEMLLDFNKDDAGSKSFNEFTTKFANNFDANRSFYGWFGNEMAALKFNGEKLEVNKAYNGNPNFDFNEGWLMYEDYLKKFDDKTRNSKLLSVVDWKAA